MAAFFPTTGLHLLQPRTPLLFPRIQSRKIVAVSRSFSSAASAAAEEHFAAKYRRRLCIGHSPVVLRSVEKEKDREPPKHGEVKITFDAQAAFDRGPPGGPPEHVLSMFDALACDSSGGLIGFAYAAIRSFPSPLGLQLYALRAAGNLALALKEHGFHDGPVVFESNSGFCELSNCLDERCCCDDEREMEAVLRFSVPHDLEDVDKNTVIDIGDPDEVIKALDHVNGMFKDNGIDYKVGWSRWTDDGGN